MFSSNTDVCKDSQNELSVTEYKEITKLTSSTEFTKRKLFPLAANEMINLYNRDPLVQLDPRKCCSEINNFSVEEILYNFAYLDFWQSINHKSQYTLDSPQSIINDKVYEHEIHSSHKHDSGLIKNESQTDETQPNTKIDTMCTLDHSMKCVSCGRSCRYLMYILIPPITNGNLSPISSNCDLSECIWCPKCYSSGRIPPSLSKNHFSMVQIPFEFADKNSIPWTQYQIQLLIEAIGTYTDDWESIGKYVGKSPHECLLKFSQLPIEELVNKGSSFDTTYDPVVFGKTPNEFLAYLAFISNSLSPVISSGGAKAALEILLSDSKFDQVPTNNTNTLNNNNEPMFRHETFKIACDAAKQSIQKNAQLLADLEHLEIQKLLKNIYDLEIQITAVQTEKFEVLEQKLHECTKTMADLLITKS